MLDRSGMRNGECRMMNGERIEYVEKEWKP